MDYQNLPEHVKNVFITQEDEFLILDPQMVLMEFFGTRKFTEYKSVWDAIKEYNQYVFNNKVKVLKTKVEHLKEANERLVDEVQYLKWVNAEFITILKNKGVDTHAIIRDYKQKRQAVERERERMEKNKIVSKIESLK